MKKLLPPVDANSVIRFLHIHCFIHMYRVFFSQNASDVFSEPRFSMFKPIKHLYKKKETTHSLFRNLLFTYQNSIIIGCIITLIFASCNLLVPQLIKSFLHFMHDHHTNKKSIASAQNFIQKFFVIQILRILFGEHAKRLFFELAIQIQSSLAKKLVRKSLSLARQCRDKIPRSQIIQFQNVDLKLIFILFKNMYLIFEAPFTIFVAIVLLFMQSQTYGMIGIYWFLIAFLLQRQLDEKMTHCNQTKLKLIDERSKLNYQLFSKMKQAKIIHYQTMLVQKNNDLFIHQNQDHHLFYFYSTLYDITLLILPIIVVVTISLFDASREGNITIEQVLIMLQLLGICYNPMKSFRTISISLHDGLHSLRRLQIFFDLPDQIPSALINSNHPVGELMIKKGTRCTHPHSQYNFQIHIQHHIQLKQSERLIVIGKRGQGCTSFLKMIMGQMKKIQENIFINSQLAYCGQQNFFMKSSVRDNMLFFCKIKPGEQKMKERQLQDIYKQFEFQLDFKSKNGLQQIVDVSKFSKKQLKKMCIARVLLSQADIYLLDQPFKLLDKKYALLVQKKLRQKQYQGKTVIITVQNLEFIQPTDYVLILQQGKSKQYGKFQTLIQNKQSEIKNFFKSKEDTHSFKQPQSARLLFKFQNRVKNAMSYSAFGQLQGSNGDTQSINSKNSLLLKKNSFNKSLPRLKLKQTKLKKGVFPQQQSLKTFAHYFKIYIKSVLAKQSLFIMLIIATAQFLHIFIHFYIGHLYQQHGEGTYLQYKNMLIIQCFLTFGLAGIIYLQGQISSRISIIQGNNLYSRSLTSVIKKPILWFRQQYQVQLADKFNHDYQQIFIACHSLLGIYKNIIILLATIYIVSADKVMLIIITSFIGTVYLSILWLLRKVQHKVVYHFYDYKYQYVKLFQQCMQGGQIINIYDVKAQVIKRVQDAYKSLASYKLAESYTAYGEQILCDFVSLIILSFAFLYGLQMKMHGSDTSVALIGTTIHLLLNFSQVLKNIVKLTVNFETFFDINISPFIQCIQSDKQIQDQKPNIKQKDTRQTRQTQTQTQNKKSRQSIKYDIKFENVILNDQNQFQISNKNVQPLNFKIQQDDNVLIYQNDQKNRAKLMLALTRNYQLLRYFPKNPFMQFPYGRILIGDEDINKMSVQKFRSLVGVIMKNNFFIDGTIRDNLQWGRNSLSQQEQQQVFEMAHQIGLDSDLKNFEEQGLDTKINSMETNINQQFTKKIAILRILVRKPKIIIIKNTSAFIGEKSIIKLLIKSNFCTIIKINNTIEQFHDSSRIIYLQNLKVVQQGKQSKFQYKPNSKVGQLLNESNIDGYIFKNQVGFSPRKLKTKTTFGSNKVSSKLNKSSQF